MAEWVALYLYYGVGTGHAASDCATVNQFFDERARDSKPLFYGYNDF